MKTEMKNFVDSLELMSCAYDLTKIEANEDYNYAWENVKFIVCVCQTMFWFDKDEKFVAAKDWEIGISPRINGA